MAASKFNPLTARYIAGAIADFKNTRIRDFNAVVD
jgi:hypothetical protein